MNILITRPDERGQELLEMLNQHHIFALHLPLFRLEAGGGLPQLPALIARLNAGDGIFAVSRHAIDFASQTLTETGFHYRTDLNYFAVGQHSAAYFSAKTEQLTRYPIFSENSEGLLQLPEMQDLTGKNLLILRAETGRTLLADEAIKRGALVQYVECYRRHYFAEELTEKISLCKRSGIDTIIITSGEILQIFTEKTAQVDQSWLMACRLIVVSSRIAKLAYQLGWQADKVIISDKADNHSLLETVLKCANTSV